MAAEQKTELRSGVLEHGTATATPTHGAVMRGEGTGPTTGNAAVLVGAAVRAVTGGVGFGFRIAPRWLRWSAAICGGVLIPRGNFYSRRLTNGSGDPEFSAIAEDNDCRTKVALRSGTSAFDCVPRAALDGVAFPIIRRPSESFREQTWRRLKLHGLPLLPS